MVNNIVKQWLLSSTLILFTSSAYAAGEHDHDSHGYNEHGHENHAGDHSPFYAHIHLMLHTDSVISADDADREINEAYAHGDVEAGVRLGQGFSVNTVLKLEGHPSGHSHRH